MHTCTWSFFGKTGWDNGASTGLLGLALRNQWLRARCGYVGMWLGRPWHGRPYREIVARVHTHGLSFAGLSEMEQGAPRRCDVLT